MEQTMERLRAEIWTNREEINAIMKACLEKLEANQEKSETETEAYPERLQTNREKVEDKEELETNQGRIRTIAEQHNRPPCVRAKHVLAALQGQASDAQEIPTGPTFEKRRRMRPECSNGIRDEA